MWSVLHLQSIIGTSTYINTNSTTDVIVPPQLSPTTKVLTFEKCDIDYFTNSLNLSTQINTTYCINTTKYTQDEMSFLISPDALLGHNDNTLSFVFGPKCEGDKCTAYEIASYITLLSGLKDIKVFLKYKIPAPLNLHNPVQSATKMFTLSTTSSNTNIYFKLIEINSDSSVFPYMPIDTMNFLSFEYVQFEDMTPPDSEMTINFSKSDNASFINRNMIN